MNLKKLQRNFNVRWGVSLAVIITICVLLGLGFNPLIALVFLAPIIMCFDAENIAKEVNDKVREYNEINAWNAETLIAYFEEGYEGTPTDLSEENEKKLEKSAETQLFALSKYVENLTWGNVEESRDTREIEGKLKKVDASREIRGEDDEDIADFYFDQIFLGGNKATPLLIS
jgi:hypothetical protein